MITTSSLRSMGARHVRPHTIPSRLAEGWEEDGEGEVESGTGRGGEIEKVPAYSAMGHRLASAGPLLWCVKCVAFAHLRHGAAFKQECKGNSNPGARKARRQRLAQGQHPLTGELL